MDDMAKKKCPSGALLTFPPPKEACFYSVFASVAFGQWQWARCQSALDGGGGIGFFAGVGVCAVYVAVCGP